MVWMFRKPDEGTRVVYDYAPEKKDARRGTVAVDRETRERFLIAKSPDEPRSLSCYRGHAWNGIDIMLDDGNLLEETYNAWY